MPTPADLSLLVFPKCLFVFLPGNNVQCDDTTSCPDGNTCCKTKDGSWGCCPLPEVSTELKQVFTPHFPTIPY